MSGHLLLQLGVVGTAWVRLCTGNPTCLAAGPSAPSAAGRIGLSAGYTAGNSVAVGNRKPALCAAHCLGFDHLIGFRKR